MKKQLTFVDGYAKVLVRDGRDEAEAEAESEEAWQTERLEGAAHLRYAGVQRGYDCEYFWYRAEADTLVGALRCVHSVLGQVRCDPTWYRGMVPGIRAETLHLLLDLEALSSETTEAVAQLMRVNDGA